MRGLLVLLVTLVIVSGFIRGADASPPGDRQADYSNTWHGITFVGGLGACPLFGAHAAPSYSLRNVDLTDRISSTYRPHGGLLYRIDSVGAVHGVINAPDGHYSVTGQGFKEHRIGDLAPLYFSGTGQAAISGPGGTVVGMATFQDLLDFPPQEFDLLFTHVTSCDLK